MKRGDDEYETQMFEWIGKTMKIKITDNRILIGSLGSLFYLELSMIFWIESLRLLDSTVIIPIKRPLFRRHIPKIMKMVFINP